MYSCLLLFPYKYTNQPTIYLIKHLFLTYIFCFNNKNRPLSIFSPPPKKKLVKILRGLSFKTQYPYKNPPLRASFQKSMSVFSTFVSGHNCSIQK